ncbi:hypothetical protein K7432_013389 [Basidiobolus ranarum]|uniref:Uncharacterized protein n=1 Tax=Basidiobolus ranarum TaxID=34480 RepID=A0ABR2VQW0_9FUNG
MCVEDTPSTTPTTSSLTKAEVKIGEEHFNQVRSKWTGISYPRESIPEDEDWTVTSPELISKELRVLHKGLLVEQKTLKKPVPLSKVVEAVSFRWRFEEWFPH